MRAARALPGLLVASTAALLIPSALRPDLLPCFRDLLDFVLPMKVVLARALETGELPLWDPWTVGGHPFLANLQSQVLYPPNWIFAVVDVPWGLSLFLAGHLAWAGAGAYRLTRALGGARSDAALAAGAYLAGGFVVSLADLTNQLCTVAWMPWSCWTALRFARRGRPGDLALWAASLGLSFLAAAPQHALLGGLTSGAVATVAAPEGRRLTRGVLSLGLAGLLAGLACAPQLVPFAELVLRSDRMAGAVHEGGRHAFEPRALAALVRAPTDPFAGPAGPYVRSLYLGPFVLLPALAAAAWRRCRWTALFGGTTALGVLLAVAPSVPGLGTALLGATPFLRYPAKYFCLAALGLALLSGLGLQAWRRRELRARRGHRLSPGAIHAACWLIAVLALVDLARANRSLSTALPADVLLEPTSLHLGLEAATHPEGPRVHASPPYPPRLARRARRVLAGDVTGAMRERVELLEGGLPAVFRVHATWGGAALVDRRTDELLREAIGPRTVELAGQLHAGYLLAPAGTKLPLPLLPFEGGAAQAHLLRVMTAPPRSWPSPGRAVGPPELGPPSDYPGWREDPPGTWTFRPTGWPALVAAGLVGWGLLAGLVLADRRRWHRPEGGLDSASPAG